MSLRQLMLPLLTQRHQRALLLPRRQQQDRQREAAILRQREGQKLLQKLRLVIKIGLTSLSSQPQGEEAAT